MDKQLILSVAGSGKTSYIVDRLDSSSKALILTYTDNNYINIRRKILEKLEVIPPGVKVFKYFNFLYTFCYRPFLRIKLRAKGFNFNSPPSFTFKLPRKNLKFYLDTNSQLYHNRVSKLLEEYNLLETINERISKYFQNVYIDEVQDFGGHDFNLLVSILKANTNITLVGDFFQHTYDTSKDGRVNSSLYDDEKKYIKIFQKNGASIDSSTLNKSYRCCGRICKFISENLSIKMQSNKTEESQIYFIQDDDQIWNLYNNNEVVKLFYQKHKSYLCFSENWGSSKGLDKFQDVCVVLNEKTFEAYKNSKLSELAPTTRNKLYVACTRASRNLFFIREKDLIRVRKKYTK